MTFTELLKLVGLMLFGLVMLTAGFFLGMAREQYVWQQAAVHNHAAEWRKNSDTGEWSFHWRPSPRDSNKAR
jgi:hypothetical protein